MITAIVRDYRAAASPCADLYDDEPFDTIEKALIDNDGNTATHMTFTIAQAQRIVEAEGRLRQRNDDLIRASCATVT